MNNIQQLVNEYFSLRYPSLDDEKRKNIMKGLYGRYCKSAKLLIQMAGDDSLKVLRWVSTYMDTARLDWTLETVVNWYPRYLENEAKFKGVPDEVRKYYTDGKV